MDGKQCRPDQTSYSVTSNLVYTVCSGVSVPIIRVITEETKHISQVHNSKQKILSQSKFYGSVKIMSSWSFDLLIIFLGRLKFF